VFETARETLNDTSLLRWPTSRYRQCSVEILLNITNSSKPSDCGNCVDLEIELLQALYELRLCLKNVFVIDVEYIYGFV